MSKTLYLQALRVVWLPLLTTLPRSEPHTHGPPPSGDILPDLSDGAASFARLMADPRDKRLVRRGRFVYYGDDYENNNNVYFQNYDYDIDYFPTDYDEDANVVSH